MVYISWECSCNITSPGESVYIVGNHTQLGQWRVVPDLESENAAVKLVTDKLSFPYWRTKEDIRIRGACVLEYKFIIKNDNKNCEVKWEPFSGNRFLYIDDHYPEYRCVVACVWGTTFNNTVKFEEYISVEYRSTDCLLSGNFSSDTMMYSTIASYGSGSALSSVSSLSRTGSKLRGLLDKSRFILSTEGDINDYYILENTIGRGTWGEVKIVIHRETGAKRAAKKIPKFYVEDVDRFRQEIEIMKSLDHPNIIRLYETFEDNNDIYLVMELCTGGELFERVVHERMFTESDAARIMKDVLSAVAYCHKLHVAHRDLKLENFLFLTNEPNSPLKLIDFGLAARFKPGEAMITKVGTPYYVSPQVLEGRYGPECDEWSAGVMMYVLLCGYPPFSAPSDYEVMAKIKEGHFTFPENEWINVSPLAESLIKQLLTKSPKQRITAAQALKHEWFEKQLCLTSKNLLLDNVISNFRRFQGLSRLKKIAFTVIAQNLDEKDILDLHNTFIQFDTSHDGFLSRKEIIDGITKTGCRPPIGIDALLDEIDPEGTDMIPYTDFIAICLQECQLAHESACKAAFKVFDIDGDGHISKNELLSVIYQTNRTKTSEDDLTTELEEFMEGDLNRDGTIDFDEFCQVMRRMPSRILLGGDADDAVNMMKRCSSRTNLTGAVNLTP
ncbi:protein kinase domain-containing protein [Cryptosporidium serpentis]